MKAKINIIILAEQSNLVEQLTVLVGRDWWDIHIESERLTVISRKEYEVPDVGWSGKDDMDLDSKLHRLIDSVVAHTRDTAYISFDLTLKWGYEAWYGQTHAVNTLDLYPSIHQNGSTTTYDIAALDVSRAIFNDLGSTKNAAARTMMGYWRRAEELSNLSFHTEAYLNFFKVLECFETLNENENARNALLDRFAPKVAGTKRRLPMKKIRRHIGKTPNDDALVKHIAKAATMFASAKSSVKLPSDFFIFVLDLIHVRNHYNVAHHLLRVVKNDWFIGVGQHSDEFEYVIPDLNNMKSVSKMLILNYTNQGKYQYNGREHKWEFK